MAWNVEYTDTFAGEANYCWVKRATLPRGKDTESDSSVMRRARAAVGLTGIRGHTYWHGDSGEFRPTHSCTVMFVNWKDTLRD